ncbi:MAG: four-carbon acid sugar kinase family protein [Anaerobiospirillum succiniciproducens]|uniref:four-carbon acid sugar kinase family protein n=1 Tax=Anaerobiospirillum succiniciproducens TaxID=13335 RepID=UPI002A75E6C8|nr:four-carbon acid sugar kinase family protein [Anaerobiospirillum succiniciproducens]MDY2798629.1 four-carbon acid sugar kinase family protein [Anaerobiospirillum succiniciproducens]
MAQCVVIADEITGASAVAAMLQKNRSTVCSLASSRGLKDPLTKDYECLVYSTNSRNLMPIQSYQMVFYAGKLLKSPDIKLYAKRIDPAMRGNTCAETQALLDALGDNDRVAIVVPGFPELKRSNVGGYILVDGKPMEKSLAGLEDLHATEGSRVADLFTEKFRYKSDPIYLKDLLHGPDYLANKIKALASSGTRALVFDCTSQQDINTIADAVLMSGIKFLAVDPGPFTATMARKVMRMQNNQRISSDKIFGLVGGSNPLIAAQVEMLRLEEKTLFVPVKNIDLIVDDQTRAVEIERVVNNVIARAGEFTTVFAVSDNLGANAQTIMEFNKILEQSNRSAIEAMDIIATAYAQITHQVIERCPEFRGIYSTGAEYTVAICRELKSLGFNIQGQVLPLTSYGHLLGGPYEGLHYVASASSATDPNTLIESIQYLRRKMVL